MLVLHALLVIILLFVGARPHRIEDVREPDEAQKIGARDTGIRRECNHQRMEASPNTHLPLPSTLTTIPYNHPLPSTIILC
jgi:hypothetical protein